MSKIVLAIDPGRKKCGMAIVDSRLNFITGEVINTEKLVSKVHIFLKNYGINHILVGSGTHSGEIIKIIREEFPQAMLTKVTEKYTSMEARKRYFKYHPPKGIVKILPSSFRIPPHPYDDFAALLIAERFFVNLKKDLK